LNEYESTKEKENLGSGPIALSGLFKTILA